MPPSIPRAVPIRERMRRLRRSAWLLSIVCVVSQIGAAVIDPAAHARAPISAGSVR